MGLFDRWFAKTPRTHTAVISRSAANEVRRIAAEHGFAPSDVSVLIRRDRNGWYSLDVVTDPSIRAKARNAVAESQGLVLVMPGALVDDMRELVVRFVQGSFYFGGADFYKAKPENPSLVTLSEARAAQIFPSLATDEDAMAMTAMILEKGDSRAAVVASIRPLVIAAYSDDLRAVALLRWPDGLVAENGLFVGSRLLTSIMYASGSEPTKDILDGRVATKWTNMQAIIADFLTDDAARIAARMAEISGSEWQEAERLAAEAMARSRGRYRDGCPTRSGSPAY